MRSRLPATSSWLPTAPRVVAALLPIMAVVLIGFLVIGLALPVLPLHVHQGLGLGTFAVARRWPEVLTDAVDPGWMPTKIGGPGAPDDLEMGHLTQTWLSVSDEPAATVSGGYWYHRQRQTPSINDLVDDAYRAKYRRSPYLGPMVGARARSATVKVMPREADA